MDYDAQEAVLQERRKRYAQQLAQRQMPEGRMAGRVFVAPNPLEYLAAGLRDIGAMQGEAQAEKELGTLRTQRSEANNAAYAKALRLMRGTPENAPADGMGPVLPAQGPNPMGAFEALGEGPDYRQAAFQGLTQQAMEQAKLQSAAAERQRQADEKAAAQARMVAVLNDPNLTPQQKIAMGVPKEALDPGLGRTKGQVVNGQLVDPYAIGAVVPPQAPAPNRATDLLLPDPANPANMIPNQALIGVKSGLAKDSAARIENRVDARTFNTQESEQSKAYGKSLGDMRASINQAGFDAPGKLARLDRMEQLLAGIDGGAAAPAMADVASFANSLGIKLDPKLGNKQAAEALAREMAGTLRQPGTGPMTDKDFDNFLRQVPSLSKTAQGRAEIITTMRGAIERDRRAAQFQREYAQRNNGVIDDKFFDALAGFYAQNPVVLPKMPETNARGAPFNDPAKEKRYQEWLKTQGAKQ